jgi:hypothetical protein
VANRKLTIEEPGSAPSAEPVEESPQAQPVAPTIDDSDPKTLLDDVAPALAPDAIIPPSPIIEVVQPPLIERSTGHLPDASEVDPTKIKVNTLTKQGWVLPEAATAQAAG